MNSKHKEINFASICRICLKNDKNLFNLFKTEAFLMLKFCGFLDVIEGDELPEKICGICSELLVQSYKLKQLCLSSDSYLQSLICNNDCEKSLPLVDKSEHLLSQKCEDSESDRTNLDSHTVFSSKKLVIEQTYDILTDSSVLPDNEFTTNNQPLLTDSDQDSICDSEIDNKKTISYTCPQCNVHFEHKKDVLVHQSIHSGKELKCNVCNKLFRSMKFLKRHIKTHMITKPHICKTCNKGFTESSALCKHMKQHHLREPRDKKYICDECGQRFTDQYYLTLHTRKHTGEKPFTCEICNKSFYDPRSYKPHMDSHKGVRSYLCSYCGKSFIQSGHLRQHLLVHSKEKSHRCNMCHKSFRDVHYLRRHYEAKHDLFYCFHCTKSFGGENQLHQHTEICHVNRTNDMK